MPTRSATEELSDSPRAPREIEVPAPTAWPFLLALGVALLFAGLVTSTSVSVLGAALALVGVTLVDVVLLVDIAPLVCAALADVVLPGAGPATLA